MRSYILLFALVAGCSTPGPETRPDDTGTSGKADDGDSGDQRWSKFGGRIAVGLHRCDRLYAFDATSNTANHLDCDREVVDAELETIDRATKQPAKTAARIVEAVRSANAAVTQLQREAEENGLHNGERTILYAFREESLARLIAAWIDVGGVSGWRGEPHESDVSSVLKTCGSLADCEANLVTRYRETFIEGIRYNANTDATKRIDTAFADAFASFRGLCELIAGQTAPAGAASADAENCARSAVGQLDVTLDVSEYAPGY